MFKFIRTQINHGCHRLLKMYIICFNDMIRSFRFNPNYVNISPPNIIYYLILLESSTWQFQVRIFVALSLGKVNSTLNFILVVILSVCMCHCITTYCLGLGFSIILPITNMNLSHLVVSYPKWSILPGIKTHFPIYHTHICGNALIFVVFHKSLILIMYITMAL